MPHAGKRQDIGRSFLSAAPASFRVIRLFPKIKCLCPVIAFLSVLWANQGNPAGGGEHIRVFPGMDIFMFGRPDNLFVFVSVTEKALAHVK